MSAVLLAVVTGAGGTLGGQLWAGVASLVRRPSHRKGTSGGTVAEPRPGEAELLSLQESPADRERAAALAKVLLARSAADALFLRALERWWARAEPILASAGDVTNTISGGTKHGPVALASDLAERHTQTVSHLGIGGIHLMMGHCDSAADDYRVALRLSQEIADPLQEGYALKGLGRPLLGTENVAAAREFPRSALVIFDRAGSPEADEVRAWLERSAE